MARNKVTENNQESNRPHLLSRGPSYCSTIEFTRGYINPIFNRTPARTRFLIVYLDKENRVLSHQTLAISHPPKRRIDLKRCLSLGRKPVGAVRCAFVHNHPSEKDPQWTEQDTEATNWLFSLAYRHGLDQIDHILLGSEVFRSGLMKGHPLCRGWEDKRTYASG